MIFGVNLNGHLYPILPSADGPGAPLEAVFRTAVELVRISEMADPENGGPGGMEFEELDAAWQLASSAQELRVDFAGPDGPQETSLEFPEAGEVRLDFAQLSSCAKSVDLLLNAYSRGATRGGSVEWSDVDEAIAAARAGLPNELVARLGEQAREANGCEDDGDGQVDAGASAGSQTPRERG